MPSVRCYAGSAGIGTRLGLRQTQSNFALAVLRHNHPAEVRLAAGRGSFLRGRVRGYGGWESPPGLSLIHI